MAQDRIGTSRVGRAVRMTSTAAGVAGREATGRFIAGARPSHASNRSNQQLRSAQALVKLFSGMRGAAMKVGQTLSAVDLGLVPEEVRPQFQEMLATLQHDAEPVSFRAIAKVIEADLGRKVGDVFADIDETPVAAASIGQVHRGRLRDGRHVAVKVQYPGIAEAVHADLRNLKLGLKLLSAIAPGIDTASIADEIRERISEELDYELEATNHSKMFRVYHNHPFVVVPAVIGDLCRERVLVTEYVDGQRFSDARMSLSQEQRDRAGEILVRFYLNGPLRHRLLNGDPHPGNCLFLSDGRVGFLDFGFAKRLDDRAVRQLVDSTAATYRQDAQGLLDVVTELGALPADRELAQPFLENYKAIFGWLLADEPLAVDPTQTADMMRRYTAMRRNGFERLDLPAEHFVLMRAVMLLIGTLGQLGARRAWFSIISEWLFNHPPATALGQEEADFFADRYPYPAPAAA